MTRKGFFIFAALLLCVGLVFTVSVVRWNHYGYQQVIRKAEGGQEYVLNNGLFIQPLFSKREQWERVRVLTYYSGTAFGTKEDESMRVTYNNNATGNVNVFVRIEIPKSKYILRVLDQEYQTQQNYQSRAVEGPLHEAMKIAASTIDPNEAFRDRESSFWSIVQDQLNHGLIQVASIPDTSAGAKEGATKLVHKLNPSYDPRGVDKDAPWRKYQRNFSQLETIAKKARDEYVLECGQSKKTPDPNFEAGRIEITYTFTSTPWFDEGTQNKITSRLHQTIEGVLAQVSTALEIQKRRTEQANGELVVVKSEWQQKLDNIDTTYAARMENYRKAWDSKTAAMVESIYREAADWQAKATVNSQAAQAEANRLVFTADNQITVRIEAIKAKHQARAAAYAKNPNLLPRTLVDFGSGKGGGSNLDMLLLNQIDDFQKRQKDENPKGPDKP